jgi:tRNA dimethylallyltransferase
MTSEASDKRPPVVVVTGPTASGKTPFAIEIAQRFDGEIVNADSMQIYRGMDIGTAKASPEQRAAVPHHLIDIVAPDTPYDAAHYLEDARIAAARIHDRGKLVVLTGGTGLYIRVFLEGLITDVAPDPELREALEHEHASAVEAGDPECLHRRLEEIDPEAAARIHANDLRRTIRALEIARGGSLASDRRRTHGFGDRPYRVLHLALDPGREVLNERIDRRCSEMIDAGLLQEVRDLRERGYGPELPSMQSIGYRHLQPVVAGSDTLANALTAMQRDTRRFARRQRTWLRKVPDCVWLDPSESERADDLAAALLRPR